MQVCRLATLAGAVLCALASLATAQRAPLVVSENRWNQLGLESVWSSQAQLDPNRASADALALQIVGLDSHESLQSTMRTVYEVRLDGRVRRFRENDTEGTGAAIGREEAARRAKRQQILWSARGGKPTLTERQVPQIVLYSQSGRGSLHAFDAESGRTLWAIMIGNPRYPTGPIGASDQYVASVNGSTLYVMNRVDGAPILDQRLTHRASASPAVIRNMVFVPATDGRMTGYPVLPSKDDEGGDDPWQYASGAPIVGQPIATPRMLCWATKDGKLFIRAGNRRQMRYLVRLHGEPCGHLAYLPSGNLVAATREGYVSAIDERSGDVTWEVAAGSELVDTPVAIDPHVYVITREQELLALSAKDGERLWKSQDVTKFLAAGKERVYGLNSLGQLIVIDKSSGRRLAAVTVNAAPISVSNFVSDRIYLAAADGQVVCLREVDAAEPTIYWPLPTPTAEDAPKKRIRRAAPSASGDTSEESIDDAAVEEDETELSEDAADMPADEATDDAAAEDATDAAPSESDADASFDFGDDAADEPAADAKEPAAEDDANPFEEEASQ